MRKQWKNTLHSNMNLVSVCCSTTKSNVQSSIWAKVMKLGMCVVLQSSIIHLFGCWCAYQVTHLHIHPKGGPRCIFCEYSERVIQEPQNCSFILFYSLLYYFVFAQQVMAIAILAVCYNNANVFSGVVKIRKGQAVSLILKATTMGSIKGIMHHFAQQVSERGYSTP